MSNLSTLTLYISNDDSLSSFSHISDLHATEAKMTRMHLEGEAEGEGEGGP